VLVLLVLNSMGLLQLSNPTSALRLLNSELPRFLALVLAITVHEFSHGFVATLFGDELPRKVGRLTLNPLKHLDPIGTIMILVGPIGWGRPMPINPAGMRNPNLGWALSSLAGPVSNIVAATVAAGIFALISGDVDQSVFRYFQRLHPDQRAAGGVQSSASAAAGWVGFLFGLAPRPLKIALLPLHQYGSLILLAIVFLPPLRIYLDTFIGTGLQLILPPLQEVCQCSLRIA